MMKSCRDINRTRPETSSWYVAVTNPHKECVAIANLRLQKFRTFFPRIAQPVSRQRRGRNAMELAPLFPGYVFVSFDRDAHRWQSINGTFGIRGLIGGEARGPACVPQATMTALFSQCPDGVWERASVDFSCGDQVEVTSGPFAGTHAKFDEFLAQDRVRILLELMHGSFSVSLPKNQIEKIK